MLHYAANVVADADVRPDLAARDVPDLQIHFTAGGIPEAKGIEGLRDHFNLKHSFVDTFGYNDEEYRDDAFCFLPTLLHPK